MTFKLVFATQKKVYKQMNLTIANKIEYIWQAALEF